jgi:hypothetical protein
VGAPQESAGYTAQALVCRKRAAVSMSSIKRDLSTASAEVHLCMGTQSHAQVSKILRSERRHPSSFDKSSLDCGIEGDLAFFTCLIVHSAD